MLDGDELEAPQIISLIKELNEKVAQENPAYYSCCEARPNDAYLEELRKEFKAERELRSKQE